MKMARDNENSNNKKRRSLSGSIAALIAAGFVAGCSQVPDAVNPVQWYNNSVEFFAGEDEAETTAENTQEAQPEASKNSADAEFPLLSGIDQQQQRAVTRQRAKRVDVNANDRKYAPAIARQGEELPVASAPPAPPPTVTADAPAAKPDTMPAAAPAPAAQPKAPVEVARAVASLPDATNRPAALPSTGTPQHDDFQARFAKRLAEIRAQASLGTTMPASADAMVSDNSADTVVVSSTGIERGYGSAAASVAKGVAAMDTQTTYVEQAMTPIGPGAVKVATIQFENGSARLSSRDRQILANVMKLKKERGGRIRVVGHASSRTRNTDPVRHKMINFRVSAARADAIAKELMRMGADRAQLEINAISDSAPQYLEIMPTGEAGNRRAEIYLES